MEQYQLSAGDVIRISVYGEQNLSVDSVKIDDRETFDYPYLGEINLSRKTLNDIKNIIYSGLKGDYLVEPKVSVSIVKYRNIYVNGMVNKPGGYEYQPGLTVQKAISLSGGVVSKYRRSAKVYHIKASEFKKYKDYTQDELIDKFELDTKNEAASHSVINAGDTIFVFASFW
jgi:polysaccharide export outer membrane protein